ncbi:MAG: FHA domain-containing protein [Phycisphaerales bacterium]
MRLHVGAAGVEVDAHRRVAPVELMLVYVTPDGKTKDVPMKRQRLVFGRQAGCDVRVPSAGVSREHCEIRVEDGKAMIRDLGSSNGTYVDQHRVREAELSAGAVVTVGPAIFLVRIDGKPAAFDPKRVLAQGTKPVGSATTVRAPKGGLDEDENEGTSISDLDFDFLDDEEDDKKKL